MIGKIRLYILKNNYTPVSWQLRSKSLVNREGKGLREIIYVEGGHSIWRDDYDINIQINAKQIWFEDGSFLVNPQNKLLIDYLETHPDFNLKFKLDDPEADAIRDLASIKKQDEVKDELLKLDNYDALVESLSRKDEVTLHLTPAQKELRCYQEAQKDPEKVLKAIADPQTTTKYLIALALSKNIIALNTQKTQIIWSDNKEVIVALPLGQKPSSIMAEFLFEPKSEGTLAELQKRVNALSSERDKSLTTKKTVSKKR
ncbi:hypothetical protein [Aquimarina longa]|uniref:hypothetical protein n=1 Tax=Aquimarina longa TaxID=1080221 RepID=UPI0007848C81|nr:hypothetical protein [Aquimarina longa]